LPIHVLTPIVSPLKICVLLEICNIYLFYRYDSRRF
jgi:hypothetical protein